MKIPPPGTRFTFSTGTSGPDPSKWRALRPQQDSKLNLLLRTFPDLIPTLNDAILVNCYPASLLPPEGMSFVDTYGRWQTVAASLCLAAAGPAKAALVGMPLAMAHLLLRALHAEIDLPRSLVIFLGGYPCPSSLENFLVKLLADRGVEVHVIHLYGVGEIEAGLLAARRNGNRDQLNYLRIDPCWEPMVIEGELCFRRNDQSPPIRTGDTAVIESSRVILGESRRFSSELMELLESWCYLQWTRRSGFVCRGEDGIVMQCREGIYPSQERNEMDYFEYRRMAPHDWLDKPVWR